MSCAFRKSIDRHFAGSISPSEERTMREHLPGCDGCSAYYERHMTLARLDPRALGPEERLARGLGQQRPRVFPLAAGLATLAAAAAVLLVVHGRSRATDDGFAARGSVAEATASHVLIYQVDPGRGPRRATDTLRADDELAFAYENRGAKGSLMIFGVDEHQHVYWFFPAWTDEAQNPTAIPVEIDAARHPLPEAVRHKLDGHRLDVHALFLDGPLTVRDVERLVSEHPRSTLPIPGALESTTSFTVLP